MWAGCDCQLDRWLGGSGGSRSCCCWFIFGCAPPGWFVFVCCPKIHRYFVHTRVCRAFCMGMCSFNVYTSSEVLVVQLFQWPLQQSRYICPCNRLHEPNIISLSGSSCQTLQYQTTNLHSQSRSNHIHPRNRSQARNSPCHDTILCARRSAPAAPVARKHRSGARPPSPPRPVLVCRVHPGHNADLLPPGPTLDAPSDPHCRV